MSRSNRALVAMSGGVDSSVAAYLASAWGYDCLGVTMRQFRTADLGGSPYRPCCSQQDMEDAAQAAFQLDIPHTVADFTEEFRAGVMERFVRGYLSGSTPNPCIDCNRFVRGVALRRYAAQQGAETVVTGHYARIRRDPRSGRWLLLRAADGGKDQSYVHYAMTQEQLAHTLFPLGDYRKSQVRALAAALGLVTARKRDSQDICFVPDRDYGAFLERFTGRPLPPGDIVDRAGTVLGRHAGAARYTLGQRKGLGLSLGRPVYVCGKCMEQNTVTVGPEEALLSGGLEAEDANWIPFDRLEAPRRVEAQTRYRQKLCSATAFPLGEGRFRLSFDLPQRAVTPGQAVVLYDGEVVLGGGTIARALPL